MSVSMIVIAYLDVPTEGNSGSKKLICQQEYGLSPQGICPHLDSLYLLVWEQRMQSSITTLAATDERGVSLFEPKLLRHKFPNDSRLCSPISGAGRKAQYPEEFQLKTNSLPDISPSEMSLFGIN